ncbi:MAG: hypothetical protein ACF8SC_00770 [Phycisphaerales bacterium JB037]
MTEHFDRDLLISRVIDGEASPEDWSAFRVLAARDASLWSELAAAQQDHADLRQGVEDAVRCADLVDAPFDRHAETIFHERLRVVASWGGWALAATLLLAFGIGVLQPSQPLPAGNTAGLVSLPEGATPVSTPEEAMDAYLDKGRRSGRVLHNEPGLVLVESRPLPDGSGVEVVYLRQILERAIVNDIYRLSTDEFGRRVPEPVRRVPTTSGPM